PNWSRYHLFPQLGLSLFVVAGLPWRRREAGAPEETASLSGKQARGFGLLLALLLVTQLPRSVVTHWYDHTTVAEQRPVLQQIDATDALCREYGIDAGSARRVLGFLAIPPLCPENGWDFLRGSATPQQHSDDDV